MRRLCRFAAGFAVGCAACVFALRGSTWIAGLILIALAVFLSKSRKSHAPLALFGLAAALIFCTGYRSAILRPIEDFCAQEQAKISAEVLEEPTASRYGSAVLVRVKTGGAGIRAVLYYQSDAALSPGDEISCTARLRAASPDNLERDEYYASRGVWAALSAKGQITITPGKVSLRHLPALAAGRLKAACKRIFPADVEGFLTALLTGDKQGLSYSLKNDLSRSGIYHVVAVSGMHVSLLAGLVMLLCANKRTLCASLGIPAVWFFVLLTGAGASSVRAGVMQTVLLLSGLARRERDSWTAFSLAGLLLLAENPWAIKNVGLLLSFSSTGGILLFSKPLYHAMVESKAYSHLEDNHPALAHGLKPAITAVCCSIAASAFSLPICASYFKLMSVSGFLTNALCLWLVSGIFSVGLVTAALGCLWSPLGIGLGWLLAWPSRLVLGIVRLMAGLPYSAVSLENPYAAVWTVFFFFAVWLICLKAKKLSGAVVLLALGGTFAVCMGLSAMDYRNAGFTFTALDVGQGQCLIYTAGSETSIVDCGGAQDESGELAARYLETNGVFHVDRLILTHPDADHCNGAAQLLSRIRVDTLYLPLTAIREDSAMLQAIREAARQAGTRVEFISEDTEFAVQNGSLSILKPDLHESGNNGGLCVLASHEKYDILITGDLNQHAEYRLLSRYDLQSVELLVAGHHGALTSTSEALLQRTGASSVVISVGRDNSYGHPAQETLARIESSGAAIYRTDELGTIVIRGGTYGKETGGGYRR